MKKNHRNIAIVSIAVIALIILVVQLYPLALDPGNGSDLTPPDPDPIYPSNPSILINDGAETTNSYSVKLTLSCGNADEMQFRISEGFWTNWTAYATKYTITLFVNDPFYPDYRIGVVFRNEDGTTEDAGYGDIYDDITYDPEGEPPPPPPNGDVDYTLTYVLLGVLVGLVGIVVFMKYRKIKPN